MAKKQLSLVLVLALIAGFIGGLFYNQVFKERNAIAFEKEIFENVYSKNFILLDEAGEPVGFLSSKSIAGHGPGLVLYDNNKEMSIQLEATDNGPLLRFYDKENRGPCLFGFVNGSPMLVLTAPQGPPGPQWEKRSSINMLLFYDPKNKRYLPSIFIKDDTGKLIWDAPLGLSK